jgi:hypothetical protein
MLPLLAISALVVGTSAEVLVLVHLMLVLDVTLLVVCGVQLPFAPHFHSHRLVRPVNRRASDMLKVFVVVESTHKIKAHARPVILPAGTRKAVVVECNWCCHQQLTPMLAPD